MSKCLGERERWVCIGKEREGERESWFVAKGMFGIGRRLLGDRFWRRSCGISLEQLQATTSTKSNKSPNLVTLLSGIGTLAMLTWYATANFMRYFQLS